jgi:hypothetical protein
MFAVVSRKLTLKAYIPGRVPDSPATVFASIAGTEKFALGDSFEIGEATSSKAMQASRCHNRSGDPWRKVAAARKANSLRPRRIAF